MAWAVGFLEEERRVGKPFIVIRRENYLFKVKWKTISPEFVWNALFSG